MVRPFTKGNTMKLELQGDEVQQYFDMQADLAYYQQKAQELEEELDMLKEAQYREDTGMNPIQKMGASIPFTHENEVEAFISSLPEPQHGPAVLQNMHWSEADIQTLKDRIFYQGKYDRSETSVDTICSLFPFRTRDGVISKIYDLGGRTKAGQVYPRIKK